jgi:cobalt-zinc-cadmium efflux system protein
MAHSHSHDHGHAGHSHGVSADADVRKLAIALSLIVGFMCFEVVVGLVAQSLALLSDAAHMLTDAAALGLSIVAIRLAARPAKGVMTYGLKRVEILSAQANGVSLLVLALLIVYEALRRLVNPPDVGGRLVLIVALVGIVVNLVATWTLAKANRQSLNVEGSYQHILTDLYAFVATAIAGGLIWWTGWNRFDAIAALVVAGLMLKAGVGLVRDSGRIFLEAAPRGLEPATIAEAIRATPAVTCVDDLHVWEVTSGLPALSVHVSVDYQTDCHDVRRTLETMLHERFAIVHTTIQTDHAAIGQNASTPCSLDVHADHPR